MNMTILGKAPEMANNQAEKPFRQYRQRWWSFKNIGAVYIWLLIIALFGALAPELFLSGDTAKVILNDGAVTGLVALSLVVPMAAGVFDLSIGMTLGVTSIVVAKLMESTLMDPLMICLLAFGLALTIGLVNALVVVVFRIDSFIGTLATSSILGALVIVISGNKSIASERLIGDFTQVARMNIGGVTAPVFYLLVVALLLWLLLEHTSTGRYLYATGFGLEAARLSGVRTAQLRFMSLLMSAGIAGLAGIILTARITVGSPTVGASFLLPAFAAAFVGATQLRNGRFNVWGTLIAVFLLGTGNTGLSLLGAPVWAPLVFVGVTLVVAVGLTGLQRRST